MNNIILPELGEGIMQAELVRWNFQPGQEVSTDDDVAEFVTDKAVFNVPAPRRGVLGRLYYHEGQQVPVGAVLADME